MKNKSKVKQKFSERLKDEFDFDVSAIGSYVDANSEEILVALVTEGKLVSRINVMEGIKGSEKIKMLDMDIPLQSADSCGKTPDGDILFTDKTLTVSAVKVDMNVCNKTLKGTWAQMLLALGAQAEKENMVLEDVISAFVIKKGREKNQDLMFKGDTASINPDLVFYDGFLKLWKADGAIPLKDYATKTDVTNAFARFVEFANTIPAVLLDNGIVPEIICARDIANLVIANIYNDNNFSANLQIKRDGAEISFELPTTGITVRSYPQLSAGSGNGLDANMPDIFSVPYNFMFFGTDQEGDMDSFWLKYLDLDEKIYFGAEWASGVQYVFPEYFGRLTATVS